MSYKKSGVNEEVASEWVSKIVGGFEASSSEHKERILSGIGDYASVYDMGEGRCLATACDGVGTKLLWTLEGLGDVDGLAQDLLAMTANDLLCVGASPALFLDYMAVGRSGLLEDGGKLESFVSSLSRLCLETGQLLVGGETAQLPDLYQGDHFDLAGFGVGFLSKEEFFDIAKVKEGDDLWAWPSSGPHSNGYSWLRKIFDPKNDASFISEHLMPGTRLYVNEFKALRQKLKASNRQEELLSAYHITGTGFRNFLRKQPKGRSIGFDLELKGLETPVWVEELFTRVGKDEDSQKELYSTFNMGWGMGLVFSSDFSKSHDSMLKEAGLYRLGSVIPENSVSIDGIRLGPS